MAALGLQISSWAAQARAAASCSCRPCPLVWHRTVEGLCSTAHCQNAAAVSRVRTYVLRWANSGLLVIGELGSSFVSWLYQAKEGSTHEVGAEAALEMKPCHRWSALAKTPSCCCRFSRSLSVIVASPMPAPVITPGPRALKLVRQGTQETGANPRLETQYFSKKSFA